MRGLREVVETWERRIKGTAALGERLADEAKFEQRGSRSKWQGQQKTGKRKWTWWEYQAKLESP